MGAACSSHFLGDAPASRRSSNATTQPVRSPAERRASNQTKSSSRKLSIQSDISNPLCSGVGLTSVPQPRNTPKECAIPQTRSPLNATAVFTSVAPSSHAASKTIIRTGSPRSRRRVVPPKNSARVPSAFHSVMPAPLVIREESDPMAEISALHLFGSQQLQQLSSLPTPTVVVHKAEGPAGGRDEEAALPLSPFQLRRIEVEGQRRQDYLNFSDRQYESTSRSQSECPPGHEIAEALDAFA